MLSSCKVVHISKHLISLNTSHCVLMHNATIYKTWFSLSLILIYIFNCSSSVVLFSHYNFLTLPVFSVCLWHCLFFLPQEQCLVRPLSFFLLLNSHESFRENVCKSSLAHTVEKNIITFYHTLNPLTPWTSERVLLPILNEHDNARECWLKGNGCLCPGEMDERRVEDLTFMFSLGIRLDQSHMLN